MTPADSPDNSTGARNSQRFPYLREADILSGLSDDTALRILDGCALRRFEAKTTVLRQNEPVHEMFIVAEGSVEITCHNDSGQSVILHLAARGDVFGEAETIGGCTAAATCTAMPGTTLLVCPQALLDECIVLPGFVRNLARICHDRLARDNQNKFIDQFYPVEERLRAYLHLLSADTPEITRTQAELAGLLGCARQTLNRELGRLRDRAVIAVEKGRIRVLDREALREAPVQVNGTASAAAGETHP